LYAKKKIKNACGVIDNAYMCVCGVIDTACTVDERFERPWQPLKGISIKNIYSRIVLPHRKKYINLNGLPNKKFVCSKIDHISANWNQISKRLYPANQGPRGYYLMKKPRVENLVTLSL
jgi:hypothetical protein